LLHRHGSRNQGAFAGRMVDGLQIQPAARRTGRATCEAADDDLNQRFLPGLHIVGEAERQADLVIAIAAGSAMAAPSSAAVFPTIVESFTVSEPFSEKMARGSNPGGASNFS
jgi:hypothetical protein